MNNNIKIIAKVFALLLVIICAVPIDAAEVINQGVPGDNSNDLLSRLNQDLLFLDPDQVIMMIGTNDMLNSQNAVSLEQYEANLRSLADQMTASGIEIVMMTMPPCIEELLLTRHPASFYEPYGPNGKVDLANQIITQVASDYSIKLVDTFSIFDGNIGLDSDSLIRNPVNSGTSDGVHPTPIGYQLIADAIYNIIAEDVVSPTHKIICFGDSITYGYDVLGAGTATGETYPGQLYYKVMEFPGVLYVDSENNDQVVLVGSWAASSASEGYYGQNYLHDGNTGKGSKSVQFNLNVPCSGDYEVYMRWTSNTNRASNVPIMVTHNGGQTNLTVDQRSDGGCWNLLDTFSFSEGTGTVVVSNAGTNGYVVTDAVMLLNLVYLETCNGILAAGQRMSADISGPGGQPDCYVNIYDLAEIAVQWLTSLSN